MVRQSRPTLAAMQYALGEYNDSWGEEYGVLHVSPALRLNQERLWPILQDYIAFDPPEGIRPAAAAAQQEGEGMPDDTPLVDEPLPPPIEPVAPYNDIRNDPYFVVR